MAADKAPAAPAMMLVMSEAAATDSGIGAAKTAMPGMEIAAMAMEATGAATVEGHRTGRHTCCESHDHRAREKLFSHQNLLHPDRTPISAANQRKPYADGCNECAVEQGKIIIMMEGDATCAVHVGAMLELGNGATMHSCGATRSPLLFGMHPDVRRDFLRFRQLDHVHRRRVAALAA